MTSLPKILIMGRQNVGKSTLFNKIIKKKHAIVNDTPGLTRDYIEHPAQINQYYYTLIDTGGLINDTDTISKLIKEQIHKLLEEVDLIIFVVEKSGLLPMDLEIAKMIRESGKKVVLCINKFDQALDVSRTEQFAEFYPLGFNPIIPISAEHRNNFDTLFDTINELIPKKIDTITSFQPNTIAVIGKPNVGKSSLINRLAQQERVIVTEIPGTTRDSIDIEITYHKQPFIFIDTAGIRKRSKIDTDIEYYSVNRAMKSIQRSNIILMMLAADTLITEADKKIFQFIVDEKKPCLILINKWDLIHQTEQALKELKMDIHKDLPFTSPYPILHISAKTEHNISKILPLLLEILENYNKRITTGQFNDFVQKIINKYSPPQKGGYVKIYYGTQINVAPPRFVFFTNKPTKIKDNYKSFLINKIRETYQFTGAPILLWFRKK